MIHKYDFIKEKEKAVNVEKYRWVCDLAVDGMLDTRVWKIEDAFLWQGFIWVVKH